MKFQHLFCWSFDHDDVLIQKLFAVSESGVSSVALDQVVGLVTDMVCCSLCCSYLWPLILFNELKKFISTFMHNILSWWIFSSVQFYSFDRMKHWMSWWRKPMTSSIWTYKVSKSSWQQRVSVCKESESLP